MHQLRLFDILLSDKCIRVRLHKNIEERVDAMFRNGIIEEVKALSKMSITAKQALGYKEVLGYLEGRYSLDEAKELLKKNTRHFAKRQMIWGILENYMVWRLEEIF